MYFRYLTAVTENERILIFAKGMSKSQPMWLTFLWDLADLLQYSSVKDGIISRP